MLPALADWSSKWLTKHKFQLKQLRLRLKRLRLLAGVDHAAVGVVAETTVAAEVVTAIADVVMTSGVRVQTMAAKSSSKSSCTSTASQRR
jgi:hypothetical protein